MPSDKDIVEEARALLTKCAPNGKITNGADAYLFDMRGPRLLHALADEVERLRRGEFICSRCHHRKDAEFERGDF